MKVQEVFQQVADFSQVERQRFYASKQVPENVWREVESLLAFDKDTRTFRNVVVDAAASWSASSAPPSGGAPDFSEGYVLGPYRFLRLLGRGGMGAVYLAARDDGEVDLQVAIKFVQAAGAGSPNFEERFLRERQILASLAHPGIARMLDVGRIPQTGQPYLVMEYVDGVPLDEFVKPLDLKARLRLFLQVCDAVAYSHRNLVIHRDLKPSNILVTADGTVKLVDFGIAKILDEAAAESGVTRERLLTPEYASPEQVLGMANTTATDVYSLGAVLRKVLLEAPGPAEKDLPYIVQCAMREEPAERYPGVEAMADDIRALLESRPVKARSGNAWYATRKFVRRHWLPSSLAAAAVISLMAGFIVANRERSIAQQRFAQLRRLANTTLQFDAALRVLPGSTKARQDLVNASLEYLDGLSREVNPATDPDLAMEVANGYKLMGEVQGSPRTGNLGKIAEGDQTLSRAGDLIQRILAVHPDRVDALLLGAEIASDRAGIGDRKDSLEDVRRHSEQCGELTRRLLATGTATPAQKLAAAGHLATVGLASSNMQMLPEAERHLRTAVTIGREAGPGTAVLAQTLGTLAMVLRRQGELDQALVLLREARSIYDKVSFPDERARMLATYSILSREGLLLGEDESISLGRGAEAVVPMIAARDLAEKWAAMDPNDASSRDRVVKMGRVLGDILRHTDPRAALAAYDLAIQRAREMHNVMSRRDEARQLAKSSFPLRKLGRADEGRRRLDQALAILRETGDYPPPAGLLAGEVDSVVRELAEHELETGNPGKACRLYDELLRWVEERKITPSTLLLANDFSRLYAAMQKAYVAAGRSDEAQKLLARRRALWQDWEKKIPGNSYVARQLATLQ